MMRSSLLLALVATLLSFPSFYSATPSLSPRQWANFSTSPSKLYNQAVNALGAPRSIVWSRILDEAQWSPRAGGVVEWYAPPGVVAGSFLLYGLGIYDQDTAEVNTQVWSSSTGKIWRPVVVTAPYSNLFSPMTVQDSRGYQYRVQGTNDARSPFNDVYMSSNGGRSWQRQSGAQPLPGTRYLGAVVSMISNPKILVMWGGQRGWGRDDVLTDVWMSIDEGRNWQLRTANVPWGPRAVQAGLVTRMDNGVEVIYHTMGYVEYDTDTNSGIYTNDIWHSTNMGRSWSPINAKAPWVARGDSQIEMTSSGVMIILGGISSKVAGEPEMILNDVWASLDGGYSWGLCSENAPFSNRRFQYTALDTDGYLFIMGGREDTERRLNDVWKSTFSYNDVNRVALECNLLIPSCGAGLKCLPSTSGFVSGLWGVMCDACPSPPLAPVADGGSTVPSATSAASSSSSVLTYSLILFVTLFIIVTLTLAYTLYKMRETGAPAPIPLPASWWNKSNANEALLSTNEGAYSIRTDGL